MVQPKRPNEMVQHDNDELMERPKRQNSGEHLLARPRSRRYGALDGCACSAGLVDLWTDVEHPILQGPIWASSVLTLQTLQGKIHPNRAQSNQFSRENNYKSSD